ncbi:hypothetical protein XELAEV_18028167mg, partial [Xenopus laevis]
VRLSFQCQCSSTLHKASPNYRGANGSRFNQKTKKFDLNECQPHGTVLSCFVFLVLLQTAQNLQTKPESINIHISLTVNRPNFSLQLFIDIAILYRTQNSSQGIGFTPSKWRVGQALHMFSIQGFLLRSTDVSGSWKPLFKVGVGTN